MHVRHPEFRAATDAADRLGATTVVPAGEHDNLHQATHPFGGYSHPHSATSGVPPATFGGRATVFYGWSEDYEQLHPPRNLSIGSEHSTESQMLASMVSYKPHWGDD